MRWLVSTMIAMPVWGASIAGQPQPPTPGPMPGLWASFQDDLLGDAILNTDDYRTGGLRLNARTDLAREGMASAFGVVMAADYSVLTDRGHNELPAGRCDELTASLGLAWDRLDRAGGRLRPLVVVAGGGRLAGTLAGDSIQNEIHRGFGFNTVSLDYDHDRAFAWQGNAYARLVWEVADVGIGCLGVAADAGGLLSSAHERQAFAGLRLLSMGRHGQLWVGGRHQWHGGDNQSLTAYAVAEHEEGWWIDAGLGLGPMRDQEGDPDRASWGIWIDGAVNPETKAIDGSVGLIWGVLPTGHRSGTLVPVDAQFGSETAGGVMGTRVGRPWRWAASPLYLMPVIDYRHGEVTGHEDCPGNEFDVNQFTVGIEPSLRACWPGGRVVFGIYAHADGGVRVEAIAEKEASARFARKTATRPVCTLGAGILLACRCADEMEDPDDAAAIGQVGLRLGYDRWFPWSDAEVADAAGVEHFQETGGSFVFALGIIAGW